MTCCSTFQEGFTFDAQRLSLTFSKSIVLVNGLVAIMARLFANTLADNLGFGPVSVIDVSTCFLGIVMVNERPYCLPLMESSFL